MQAPTRRTLTGALIVLVGLLLAIALLPGTAASSTTQGGTHLSGTFRDGAQWEIDVPTHWNGVALLYSHGFVRENLPANPPVDDGQWIRSELLAEGYGLVASNYSAMGWVVESAVSDQLAALAEFRREIGTPRMTIAWGESMGGMITTDLAEYHSTAIDGSLSLCGLVAGGVAEWNALLDSAFAAKTLLAPHSSVPLVDVGSVARAVAAGHRLARVVTEAQSTAEGRARIALAAAMYDEPVYNAFGQTIPGSGDWADQEANQYEGFLINIIKGNYLFRASGEQHAGGNMSWNTGVDYGALLDGSSSAREVRALYHRAGLSLSADLRKLDRAARITADPRAVSYMSHYVSFTGRLTKPQLNIHTTGDGLVPVQGEQAYRRLVDGAGRAALFRQAYVADPGHCTFTDGEELAGIQAVVDRVRTGRWSSTSASAMNAAAVRLAPGQAAAFVSYEPTTYLRPFGRR
jgi:pimeloyl-ACP methyl ester carboxylesterase